MSTHHEDITKMSWYDRRMRNEVDPEYLKSKCSGSTGMAAVAIGASVPVCLLICTFYFVSSYGHVTHFDHFNVESPP